MKQFIKEHPWRLEIVPGFLILFAIVWPLVFRQLIITTKLHEGETWFHYEAFRIFAMLLYAFFNVLMCNRWVRKERDRKYFFTVAPIWPMFMCFIGWQLSRPLDAREIPLYHLSPDQVRNLHIYSCAWLWLIPIVAVAQLIMEWSRHFVPKPPLETLPRATDVRSGDAFYYRESINDWLSVGLIIIAIIVSAVLFGAILAAFFEWKTAWPVIAAATVIIALTSLAAFGNRRITYIISAERVYASAPGAELSRAMSEIVACSVVWNETPEFKTNGDSSWPGRVQRMRPFNKYGAYLKIETSDDRSYVLGMKRPETACKLIQTAIEAMENGTNEQL